MAPVKCHVPRPNTLKDILDLMAKVFENPDKKRKVYEALWNHMSPALAAAENYSFYNRLFRPDDPADKGFIPALFEGVYNLRYKIAAATDDYGRYNVLFTPRGFDSCPKHLAAAIVRALPKLYDALDYLFYNVSDTTEVVHGGKWREEVAANPETFLHLWLAGKDQVDGVIPGGYTKQNALKEVAGKDIAVELKPLVDWEHPMALQNMVCSCPFTTPPGHHGLLGYELLFVNSFCQRIAAGEFDGHLTGFPLLKLSCVTLTKELRPLVTVTGHEDQPLLAVCKHNQVNTLFDRYVRTRNVFGSYLQWFKLHYNQILASLEELENDYDKWTPDAIRAGETVGPAKYGFIFRNEHWVENRHAIVRVTKTLRDKEQGSFMRFVNTIKEAPEALTHLVINNPPFTFLCEDDIGARLGKCGDAVPALPEFAEDLANPFGITRTRYTRNVEMSDAHMPMMPVFMMLWFLLSKIF